MIQIMTRFRLKAVLVIALVVAASFAPSRGQTPSGYAAAIEEGRDFISAFVTEHDVPGVSVTVGVGGVVVWSEGFGHADLEQRAPVTPLTRFRIGSVSKSVTAAAVARLLEEGRLDLDVPVQEYVPTFPRKRWMVTTRLVAGHLGGIRHYRGDEMLNARRYPTVLDGLTIFQEDPLEHQPGTKYLYSSYGWNLISAVVEGASGQDFLSYMRETVFEPLAMPSIRADHTDRLIPYRASFYVQDEDGNLINAPYVDNSYKWAGGGFISNTADLVRFGWAHLAGDFLKPETVRMLFTSQKTSDGQVTDYGIGWRIYKDSKGRRIVGHGGTSVGGQAILALYLRERVVAAVLVNVQPSPIPLIEVAQRLAAPFLLK